MVIYQHQQQVEIIREGESNMSNAEIANLMKKEGIFQWQIAKRLNMHETSLSRWFRSELTQEQQQRILGAIEEIRLERIANG